MKRNQSGSNENLEMKEGTVLHRLKQGFFAAVEQELGKVQTGTQCHRGKIKVKQIKKTPGH